MHRRPVREKNVCFTIFCRRACCHVWGLGGTARWGGRMVVNKTGNLRVAHAIHVSLPHGYIGNFLGSLQRGAKNRVIIITVATGPHSSHRSNTAGHLSDARLPLYGEALSAEQVRKLAMTECMGMRAYSLSLAQDACIHSCDRERERGRGRGRGREEGNGGGVVGGEKPASCREQRTWVGTAHDRVPSLAKMGRRS